jgi:hypothetical protein
MGNPCVTGDEIASECGEQLTIEQAVKDSLGLEGGNNTSHVTKCDRGPTAVTRSRN